MIHATPRSLRNTTERWPVPLQRLGLEPRQRPFRGRGAQPDRRRQRGVGAEQRQGDLERHDDVVVYAGRTWTGRAGCIRLGQKGNLAGGLVNNVHSHRWVTPATCNRFPTALDLRPR
jgi:hypothetical protein